MVPSTQELEVTRSLDKLKREPITTDGTQDAILEPIYDLLMNAPVDDHGVLHWFCAEAKPVVTEAATFLLRLYAYANNPRVELWKMKLTGVLHGCCNCVQAFHHAKTSSRNTYFGAFSKSTLDTFFATLESWEVGVALEALKEAGIIPGSNKTLSDVPPALLYHMLTTVPAFFENSEILGIIREHPPEFLSPAWAGEMPPGVLLLLFHEMDEVRIWTQQQIVGCSPIAEDKFSGAHEVVLEAVTSALLSGALDPQSSDRKQPDPNGTLGKFFTMPPSALWSGLHDFLRMLPPTLLLSRRRTIRQFCRAIIGHLHDTGPHFPNVLRAFVYLVKKLEKSLWEGEDSDYPRVVFDSIKDNPKFLLLIQEATIGVTQQPWFLEWSRMYICSLEDSASFEDILRKMVGFMCEELQHERFGSKRPIIMEYILSTLQTIIHAKEGNRVKKKISSALIRVLDIHAGVIVNVALSSKRKAAAWHKARTAARKLLSHVLTGDGSRIETAIFQLSDELRRSASSREAERKYDLLPESFSEQMWKQVYDTLDGEDEGGMALLISLVAPFAYLDTLSPEAFNPPFLPSETRNGYSKIIQSINARLKVMRGAFLDAIIQCTNSASSTPQALQSMLHRVDMVKHVTALLLSPVDELQVAAQTFLGQAYDVDVRSDCFRALLKDLPVPSLDGLTSFMDVFNDCAPLFPEACSIAKSLVRCMTDVIEVLTNGRDGLLFDEIFCTVPEATQPYARLPALWRLMCSAITVIFRRTPTWSKYYDPEVMVDWMRDALIFARDLLAQRRTFESASMPVSQKTKMTMMVSPRKPLQIGRQMLDNLQTVLTESIRWLRLTDMELLHQSSSLVLSLMDCFRETEVKPSRDTLTKLEKFLDAARRKSSPDAQTRLTETHLSELTAALSVFNQEDEEIQISSPREVSLSKPVKEESAAGGSRWRLSRQKTSMEQKKLDEYMSARPEKSTKASSSITPPIPSYRLKHTSGTQVTEEAKAIIRQNSSMVQHASVKVTDKISPLDGTRLVKDEVSFAKTIPSRVSSSSSEESDDGDDAGGLESLVKLQKSPLVKKQAQRRTVKLLEPEFTKWNPALERIRKREDAQRTALRMKPDMKPLHRIILSWIYDHDGPEPPPSGNQPEYTPIADTYKSDREYQQTFEPLLSLECWNQLIKSKEETTQESLLLKINSRQFIDDWLDLDVSVSDRPPEKWRLVETDVVLLRPSGGTKPVLAKVQSSRRMLQEIEVALRCLASSDAAAPGLHIGSQWRLTRVFSLSTIAREFAALKALPYYDFCQDILRPRPAVNPSMPASHVLQAMKAHEVNEPQAIAILGSLQVEGFSLIQGPPGTGKTWTICGLVGAFLSSRTRPATVVHAGRNSGTMEKTPPKKVLVCAPSNAAIDEVSKRLKDGIRNSEGRLVVPNIVRVGADDAINVSVKDISLDQLVDQRLNSTSKWNDASSASTNLASLRAEMDALRNTRAMKINEITNIRDNVSRLKTLEEELKMINNKRMSLSQQYNRLKDQQQSDARTLDAARRKHRAEVLAEADVICATLSGSGHEALETLEFEMVVIDEAAQSIELSSLIPLKYRSKRCILVGDPQQLPPTVLSPLANKYGYGQSLFVRLQKSRPEAVHLLSIQYRMHPDISSLPSKLFYDGKLHDGPGMDEKTARPWHHHPLFGTYKFINVSSGGEQPAHNGHSLVNRTECDLAVALYNCIKTEYPNIDLDFRIGVITMYRAQLLELKKKFRATFGEEVLTEVDFNTVDGFQGQEKDIIILSCVRAGPGVQSIGFLADQRRLNVAITRSRCSLFILGHAATLERSNGLWKEIVQDARGSSRWIDADVSTYRRTTTSPKTQVKVSTLKPLQWTEGGPSYLKTPRAIVQRKPQTASSAVGPSATVIQGSVIEDQNREAGTTIETFSSSTLPQKRRNSDGEDVKRLALGPQPTSYASGELLPELPKPLLPKPLLPPIKKRPKEVSMFIPKKKNDPKRVTEDISHGDAKRRLTEQHYLEG